MADHPNIPNREEIDAPDALIRDLAALRAPRINVPPEISARIRAEARVHLSRSHRRAWVLRAAITGAAAALVAIAFLITTLNNHAQHESLVTRDAYDPVLLQALNLARQLDASVTPAADRDINHDGRIDRGDVDALALRSVALSPVSSGSPPPGLPQQGEENPLTAGRVRFMHVDIFIDSKGNPLAAYQFRFTAKPRAGKVTIVGLENGEAAPFRDKPPYYDPAALRDSDKIVVAMLSPAAPEKLPKGKTRVTTIHLMVEGDAEREFGVELQTAVDHDGKKIDAAVTFTQGVER